MKFLRTKIVLTSVLSLTALSVNATLTGVDFNYDGVPGFDITGTQTFDWQANASLVINDALISTTTAGGVTTPGGTLGDFFLGGGVIGSSVTFRFESQSRLNDMLLGVPGAVLSGLSTTGAAPGTWEVTQVIDAVETAKVVAPGLIQFTAIDPLQSTYAFYLSTPNSNNGTGVGFTDGTKFMWGDVISATGTFDGFAGSGSSFLTQSITGYDNTIIEGNPLIPLTGTTFNTQELLTFPAVPVIGVGMPIGGLGYNVQPEDLILNSDSNTNFDSSVPEPTALFLLGSGLIGLIGFKRNNKNIRIDG